MSPHIAGPHAAIAWLLEATSEFRGVFQQGGLLAYTVSALSYVCNQRGFLGWMMPWRAAISLTHGLLWPGGSHAERLPQAVRRKLAGHRDTAPNPNHVTGAFLALLCFLARHTVG